MTKSHEDRIFELADELLGSAMTGMSDTRADEVFQLCHICKDVDGHEDWCWVPAMKRWFDNNTVTTPPPTPARTMTGTITGQMGRYFTVECPKAVGHLKHLHLVKWQIGKAQVGDRVKLEYQTTSNQGLWNVTEVLS